MLQPLQQWICDTCGGLIEFPEAGWLEWIDHQFQASEFRIVHHKSACHQHTGKRGLCDNHLNYFVGEDRLACLYSFLDNGPILDPESERTLRAKNIREFAELLRRLTIPHYEEARQYFDEARTDGFFDGSNEYSVYSQDYLREIIEAYGSTEN